MSAPIGSMTCNATSPSPARCMASRQPSDLERLLAALTAELGARQLPFMLIGGQAVLLHGSPRLTEDIDITLGVEPDALPVLLKACTALALTSLPVSVVEFVAETFVLPVRHEATRLRVDFIFSRSEEHTSELQSRQYLV